MELWTTATLATQRSWFRSFKAWENGVPEDIVRAEHDLALRADGMRVWRHQDVPLFPLGSTAVPAAALVLFLPWIAVAALLNLPPLLAAGWAGRKFPDGPNVVALWRILVGVPLFLVWTLALVLASIVSGHAIAIVALVGIDGIALLLWRRTHRLAVAVHNAVFARELRPAAMAFRETILARLPT